MDESMQDGFKPVVFSMEIITSKHYAKFQQRA